MRDKTVPTKLPEGLLNKLDKAVNEDGIFLSRSDALRYGLRLALVLEKGSNILSNLAKESRNQVIEDHYRNV